MTAPVEREVSHVLQTGKGHVLMGNCPREKVLRGNSRGMCYARIIAVFIRGVVMLLSLIVIADLIIQIISIDNLVCKTRTVSVQRLAVMRNFIIMSVKD